jgi:hypothetical protein
MYEKVYIKKQYLKRKRFLQYTGEATSNDGEATSNDVDSVPSSPPTDSSVLNPAPQSQAETGSDETTKETSSQNPAPEPQAETGSDETTNETSSPNPAPEPQAETGTDETTNKTSNRTDGMQYTGEATSNEDVDSVSSSPNHAPEREPMNETSSPSPAPQAETGSSTSGIPETPSVIMENQQVARTQSVAPESTQGNKQVEVSAECNESAVVGDPTQMSKQNYGEDVDESSNLDEGTII